jgi:hypothetical protein
METPTDIIDKLVGLLVTDQENIVLQNAARDILQTLLGFCTIAGGSIIYALDKAPIESVGDVDIFVLDGDRAVFDVVGDIFDLIEHHFQAYDLTFPFTRNDLICVFDLKIPEFARSLQFIFGSHRTPSSVIESFDVDFVMCGYFNGQLYITDSCKKALSTKKIHTFYNTNYVGFRFKKMLTKQFQVPYFVQQLGQEGACWNTITKQSLLANVKHYEYFTIEYNGITGADGNTYENPILVGFDCLSQTNIDQGKYSTMSFVSNLIMNRETDKTVHIEAISLKVKFEFSHYFASQEETQYLIDKSTDNYDLWSMFTFITTPEFPVNISMETFNNVIVAPLYRDNQFYLQIYSMEAFESMPVNLASCKKSLAKIVRND